MQWTDTVSAMTTVSTVANNWEQRSALNALLQVHTQYTSADIVTSQLVHLSDTDTQQTSRIGLDWIVQCFTSLPTRYKLYGRRFLQVKRPN